ncbi:TPA: hypothetical protein PWY45_002134 [Mannheimia haemolytica]|uniref:Uncharacterized protein n=1 Tax=Mannheimia haemolytica TaxID=75985 RepID=A0A378MTP2_MANHA|nr:hypothetical protein J450_00235 [Mannheimia haemolytica D171]EPY98964.1 hypothetical protein L278_11895 [Mannheimia haemolytica D35]NBB68250.1 hypothetical protein [Mannheimia haemolytica]TCS87551.1 hypothetical protein EDC41_11937 [Mannheimia haemolytica]STY52317.1 Uncharacterised protein [Mannheimia haemolytica]
MIKKALFALTATAVFAASAFAKDVTIPTAERLLSKKPRLKLPCLTPEVWILYKP